MKKTTKKPTGKWDLPAPAEPVLSFASFPFKLAVVQELMFEQAILEPRFDVNDFVQDLGRRSIDPMSFDGRTIRAAQRWFRDLPIPARLAESVETLTLDGGDDVYHQVAPLWDGEDERFSIKSLKDQDIEPFTRLRSIDDIGGFFGPRARKILAAHGIDVT